MENIKNKVKLTSKEQDYAQWYLDVSKAGELFEYSPTPGCITFLPKAVTLWEKTKEYADKKFKNLGVQNIYLPLLIPMSFFEKEKEHVEGFAPELAIVTHGGGKELEDKLAIRPTSETLFCDFFKNQLQSYRDLPLLYNQWVNVMRWEKRTRPFLRTTEFYWQEGHTLHENTDDAREFGLKILNTAYIDVFRNLMAIDGISGSKSVSERFAGADTTFTFEPMMSNGWALQISTVHILNRGFMEQFSVSYLNREGKNEYPAYTSWGFSTRAIGGIISSHSDDMGLIIPPKMSEYKAVILPIYGKENEKIVNNYVRKIAVNIASYDNGEPDRSIKDGIKEVPVKGESFKSFIGNNSKVLIDFRNVRLGEKITDFELSGYPIRIECGERDIENESCVISSRISGEKEIININPEILNSKIEEFLKKGQEILFERSRERLKNNIVPCRSIDEIGKAIEAGKFAIYEWDISDNKKDSKFEAEIKEKFKATTRCIPDSGQFDVIDNFKLERENTIKIIVARAF